MIKLYDFKSSPNCQRVKVVLAEKNLPYEIVPIDLRNPKENEKNSGFMPEERAWVDTFLEHGFSDVYRRLYPERVQYTWWTYRMVMAIDECPMSSLRVGRSTPAIAIRLP